MDRRLEKMEQLLEDKGFESKAREVTSLEELIALFAENGVELTPEEVARYEAHMSSNAELDEKNLEMVAGGRKYNYNPWNWKNFVDYWRGVWHGLTEKL